MLLKIDLGDGFGLALHCELTAETPREKRVENISRMMATALKVLGVDELSIVRTDAEETDDD